MYLKTRQNTPTWKMAIRRSEVKYEPLTGAERKLLENGKVPPPSNCPPYIFKGGVFTLPAKCM